MLLLNDIRQVQEMKVSSSLDNDYKWVLLPYTGNDLMFMLIHEPPPPAYSLSSNFGYGWHDPWEALRGESTDTIECISISRAAEMFSSQKEEEQVEITARSFAEWMVAVMTLRIKHRLLDSEVENEPTYPFIKRFSREDYKDQGLHAIANTVTNYFDSLFSQSKAH